MLLSTKPSLQLDPSSSFLFHLFYYFLCILYIHKCSIFVYICIPEKGIRCHYRWLLGIALRILLLLLFGLWGMRFLWVALAVLKLFWVDQADLKLTDPLSLPLCLSAQYLLSYMFSIVLLTKILICSLQISQIFHGWSMLW